MAIRCKIDKLDIATTIASGAAGSSKTILTYNIAGMKQFDITVRCSSSTGFGGTIMTAPANLSELYLSAADVIMTAGTCATKRTSFINNNENWLQIRASATATVSASHVNVYITSIERD